MIAPLLKHLTADEADAVLRASDSLAEARTAILSMPASLSAQRPLILEALDKALEHFLECAASAAQKNLKDAQNHVRKHCPAASDHGAE